MATEVPAPAEGEGDLVQTRPPGRLEAGARAAVADFAAAHPHWDGVICLPAGSSGDPSHWVHLSAGEIVSFQSFLTLRLAQALNAGDATPDQARIEATLARPERLATNLREAELGLDRDAILGALIGAEMAAAKPYWLGQHLAVIGAGALAEGYAAALAAQGVPVERG